MTQQRANHPLDYTKGPAAQTTDRSGAGETLVNVADNVQELAEKFTHQARQYSEKAQQLAQNFRPYVEKSIKEQPMTTLAAAAAIAFVLGAIWKK